MSQLMFDIPEHGSRWLLTKKTDIACRLLADRHYSRQHIGAVGFCRPGYNIVMRTALGDAVWVTWRGIRDDGFDAWECTIFRNESQYLSSELIKEAIAISKKVWGELPRDGILTHINPKKIRSQNPGCCFKKVGFKKIGYTKVNKLIILQYKE